MPKMIGVSVRKQIGHIAFGMEIFCKTIKMVLSFSGRNIISSANVICLPFKAGACIVLFIYYAYEPSFRIVVVLLGTLVF